MAKSIRRFGLGGFDVCFSDQRSTDHSAAWSSEGVWKERGILVLSMRLFRVAFAI